MARSQMDNIKSHRTAYTNYHSYERENRSEERSMPNADPATRLIPSRRHSQLNIQDEEAEAASANNEYAEIGPISRNIRMKPHAASLLANSELQPLQSANPTNKTLDKTF